MGLILAFVAGLLAAFAVTSDGRAQEAPTVGIDTDTAGNTATTLGSQELCRVVTAGEQFDVDIYITDANNLSGYEFDLHFDPQVVTPISSDDQLLITSAEGSSPLSLSASTPSPEGFIKLAIVDFGDPSTTYEDGDGILARVTMQAVGAGETDLTLEGLILTTVHGVSPGPVQPADPVSGFYQGRVLSGTVSVAGECEEPTDTPPPVTDGPGSTASPGGDVTPVETSSPSPQPVETDASGNPVDTGEGGQNGDPTADDDDGGGSSGLIWAIAAGLIALIIVVGGIGAWQGRRRAAHSDE